ncbi:DUF3021 domain-containing protein [Paenibacillus chungangensis]|uniref:DUF3021 domain-containing protein n=1 Tax=Paenibacillus chungangensis TaxID=696535 RepID=A0ABW3HNZ9_9BACL
MIYKVLPRLMVSIAYSGLQLFVVLTWIVFNDIDVTVEKIWWSGLGGLLMSLYFGLASFLFEIESWSLLRQMVTHYLLSFSAFYIVAISVGWLPPLHGTAFVVSLGIFTVIYLIIAFIVRLFLRKQAEELNKSLQKR